MCCCGGEVAATGEAQSTIVQDLPRIELVHTRHTTPVGECTRCGERVVSRLPGSSQDGTPCTQVQLGPRMQALIVSLHVEHHVPLRRVCQIGREWLGLDLSSPSATLLTIERSRGADVFDSLVPVDGFFGVLVSDYYAVYTRRDDLLHGYCGAHLIRDAKKIAELDEQPDTLRFAHTLRDLYRLGDRAQKEGFVFEQREDIRNGFRVLASDPGYAHHPELKTLQQRIGERFEGVVAFLGNDALAWHNNATEQDLRNTCVHRKVCGGTRSEKGSHSYAHNASIAQTLRKNGSSLATWVTHSYWNFWRGLSPPSLFRFA